MYTELATGLGQRMAFAMRRVAFMRHPQKYNPIDLNDLYFTKKTDGRAKSRFPVIQKENDVLALPDRAYQSKQVFKMRLEINRAGHQT